MYLIFPESMIIPEVSERREDNDFEDWLTAALIENANQGGLDGNGSSPCGVTDLWMLEIADRRGRIWKGNFHVEFGDENEHLSNQASTSEPEQASRVLSFSLDTASGKLTITSKPGRFDSSPVTC
jgi:hypothetical protein